MSVPAVTRTEGSGGPVLRGGTPPRRLGIARSLARAEALLLLRSVLVLAGLAGGAAVIWRSVWSAEPLWWNTAWQIGYGQAALAAIVLAAAQLAAGRARRDGMQDLYDSLPVSAATRTLGHLGGLAGALPASVVLAGAAAVVAQARGAIGTPSPAVLAGGVLLVAAAGAAGVAVGTRFPHPLAGILGAMVLLVVVLQSYRLLAYPALGGTPWLFPWTAPDQLGSLPGPLAGYPPGGAHAVELAGFAVLAGAAALAVTPGRTRHRTALAVTAVVAAAAVCIGGAAQLRPIPAATVNRLVSEVADPLPAEHCSTAGQVRYCVYPGFGNLLPALRQAPVRAVLARLPVPPGRVLTIAQATSLALDDPPLFHGHTGQQLARWHAELQAAPANAGAGATAAVYVPAGQSPLPGFGLALRAAEWAVRIPSGGSSGTGCVPADQAREAIAIWLAITATHASPVQLAAGQAALGGGQGFLPVAIVNHAPVRLWTEPVADFSLAPVPAQLTGAGFLLARAMANLPQGKVESVLRAAWPAWLNWHTTDARLAAALGIPMPAVSAPPGAGLPPPGAPQPPPSPLCT
jgi:hypothetical protein